MIILGIETSCDETAVCVVEAQGRLESPTFSVLGNALFSQVKTHEKYGGVFPMMAKREHNQNFPHLLISALTQANKYTESTDEQYTEEQWHNVKEITSREEGLCEGLRAVLARVQRPNIDAISVTYGPGLEPALWVGISCARALSALWDIPVIPTNHMEGHILSVFVEHADIQKTQFPALALLISGGHTELVEISAWGKYRILGQTRDDAVGEAFDKVARMMGLPYPGGPQISTLAEKARTENIPHTAVLPRPMLHSDDYDFSFSGLKTAVLYYLRDHPETTPSEYPDIAREFEDAVVDVLLAKTKKALLDTGAYTLIIAGGVVSNTQIRTAFLDLKKSFPQLDIRLPTQEMSTDNAVMIALAGYISTTHNPRILTASVEIKAQGNLKLS